MQVVVVKGVCSAHEHKTDYGDSETDDEVDDKNEQYAHSHITYKSYEYICLTCHNNLKQKEPKNASTSLCKWSLTFTCTT